LVGDDRFAYGQQWLLNKQVVCKAGMLTPKLAKANGVKQTVFYAEIDWQYLIKKYKTGLQAQEVPKFPAVRRDLSLVLDRAVTYDQVRQVALKTERKLLTDLNVFSVFEGANLGEGKKSYAIAFTLQSTEATLTDQQIDGTMTKLMQALGKELGAEIRS
jgi:phenylalanyl-tRNA synthetase beta chain